MKRRMSDKAFDDPAGRTRFAWGRTLLITFVVTLLIERIFFANSITATALLVLPAVVVAVVTFIRSGQLRDIPSPTPLVLPTVMLIGVLVLAAAAVAGIVIN